MVCVCLCNYFEFLVWEFCARWASQVLHLVFNFYAYPSLFFAKYTNLAQFDQSLFEKHWILQETISRFLCLMKTTRLEPTSPSHFFTLGRKRGRNEDDKDFCLPGSVVCVCDYTVRAFMAVEDKCLKIVHLNKTVDALDIKIIVINWNKWQTMCNRK